MSLSDNLISLVKSLYAHKSDANGHNLATQSKAGFMAPLDKAKLDSLTGTIADGSVTTAKVANKAITVDKFADKIDLGGL